MRTDSSFFSFLFSGSNWFFFMIKKENYTELKDASFIIDLIFLKDYWSVKFRSIKKIIMAIDKLLKTKLLL